MLAYIFRRLIFAAATTVAISVIAFVIIQLPPGDFVDAYIASISATGGQVSLAEAEGLRIQFGLDRPMYLQYFAWITGVVQGDFGFSVEWRRPVSEVIGDRLWMTVIISVFAILLSWGLALPIGIYSAVRQYSVGDYVFTFVGFFGLAVPNFLLDRKSVV